MKRFALGLVLGLSITAVVAQENIVLTPTNLYGMIEKLQTAQLELLTRSEFVPIVQRVSKIEKTLDCDITALDAGIRYRLNELERKVDGLQKQVTLLHGKKVDN